jgi:hypothetical protein
MIEAYALTAVALLAAGATIGFMALVCLGIRREEAAGSLTTSASDRITRGARAANGLSARRGEDFLAHRATREKVTR